MVENKNEEIKILIVDDSPINRTYIQTIISDNIPNSITIEASDGYEGFDLAKKENPDVILLDIMMPGKNGYEVCEELKTEIKTKNIPVIFLSALNELEDRAKGFESGGVDYIAKPAENMEIISRVKAHANLYKAQNKLKDYIENIERELDLARKIQQRLLPSIENNKISIDKMCFSWLFEPSFRVSGDLFNIIKTEEEDIMIYMIDVSGHGAASAMLSLTVKNHIENIINNKKIYDIKKIGKILEEETQMFFPSGSYFTLAVIKISKQNEISFVSFGHRMPIYLKNNQPIILNKTNLPLGIGLLKEIDYSEINTSNFEYDKNDSFLLYTDGLIEAKDYLNEDYFINLIQNNPNDCPEEIVNKIKKILDEEKILESPEDDITILLGKFCND